MQKTARETISRLIQRYEQLTVKEKKDYNEANTRKNYILPMFEALGWDIHEDVLEEDPAVSGRVDYSFRLNHITQFLLEAKSISENLDKNQWAKQTVEYGWNRGVPWVVLSDFEGLKLFNSEINTTHPKPIFDFKYTEYLDNFDKLWLLSKESLEQNLLDTTLTGFGIGNKRIRINEVLATDLVKWRDQLTSNFKSWNSGIDNALINESVQRILDRLIFIRVVEDKGIEDKFLWQTFQKWQASGFKPNNFIELLIPLFRKFDETYNSNLFLEHFCEKLDTEGDPFKTIVPDLYTNKQQQVSYRFDAVNADVLGKVYEQYLGYLQKGKEDKGKRKKQGIYYTPSYIVDYIVRNTIGKKLEDYSNYSEKQSIKILDPACGSGSFLINSFDYLDNYFRKLNNENIADHNIAAIRKYRILSENVYGVDLDEQAIEIAKLNLLLQAVVPNFKLPLLNKHLHVGNSLIEDKGVTDKAFEWKKEFSDVFERDNPGFDVIVGNPPYIKEFVNRNAFDNLRNNPYYQGKMDLWTLFACKAIDLLRDGGYLSFIAPNNWITNAGASIFRDKILREGEIQSFIDFGDYKVFEDAGIQTMIFVFKKQKPRSNYNCRYFKISNSKATENEVNQEIQKNKTTVNIDVNNTVGNNLTFFSSGENKILEKIKKASNFSLTEKEIAQGIVPNPDIVNKRTVGLLSNSKIKDFGLKIGDGVFVVKKDFFAKLSPQEEKYLKPVYEPNEVDRYFLPDKFSKQILYINKKNYKEDAPTLIDHLEKYKEIMNQRRETVSGQLKFYHLHWPRNESFFDEGEKLLSVRKSIVPTFIYTKKPAYVMLAFNVIKTSRIDLKYLNGLLNSKLILYWLKYKGKLQGSNFQIDKDPLLELPIVNSNDKNQIINMVNFVKTIISLKISLAKTNKNSDKYRKIENEIKEVDDKINKLVYQIYGLSSEDISEIEASLGRNTV